MSRQQTMPWLCVALACAVPAGAQAPPPCEPHRLIEVVPPTAIEDNQTLTFAVPTVQGEWFLTITRTGDLPRARVRANGAVVARPFDFHRGLRTLRVPLTLTTQNTLQIRPLGPGSLTVRVEGVVPEATVPAGTGLRVARDLEFAALQFQARGYSQSTVELPTTQGLFSLVLEPGGARGVLKWNDETPFQTLRQHQQAAIQPLTINTIRALLLGRRGSALQVRVRGTIVDEDAPQLAWESPANGMTAEPSQPLELTYADSLSGLQVESLRITVDGADVTEHFTVGDNTASATVADLPAALRGPGAHVLVAQILDRACNPATTQVTFVIGGMDTTPPVLTQPANLVLEQIPAGKSGPLSAAPWRDCRHLRRAHCDGRHRPRADRRLHTTFRLALPCGNHHRDLRGDRLQREHSASQLFGDRSGHDCASADPTFAARGGAIDACRDHRVLLTPHGYGRRGSEPCGGLRACIGHDLPCGHDDRNLHSH